MVYIDSFSASFRALVADVGNRMRCLSYADTETGTDMRQVFDSFATLPIIVLTKCSIFAFFVDVRSLKSEGCVSK